MTMMHDDLQRGNGKTKEEQAIADQQQREINQQRNLEYYMQFVEAQGFIYVETKSFRRNVYGDWEFKVVIPQEDTQLMQDVSRVIGMPLWMRLTKKEQPDADD